MEEFEDQQVIWTPEGNPSVLNLQKAQELFPVRGGSIDLVAESKDKEKSLVNKLAFAEIKQFYDHIFNAQYINDQDGSSLEFDDICVKVQNKCDIGDSPLSFLIDSNGDFDLNQFDSDVALLNQVKTGRSLNHLGNGHIIKVQAIFGGTLPEKVTQDSVSGQNDLSFSKAIHMSFPYEMKASINFRDIRFLEEILENKAESFNENSSEVNIYLKTRNGMLDSFISDVRGDLNLVQLSIGLVTVYTIFFLGGCSPVQFRSVAATVVILCVGLSYTSSQGLAFYFGWKTAGIHSLLPFLLIGIGVDDMFVIASAIDQTNPNDPVDKRMKQGLVLAGSSITITSFTNAFAFFLGCSTSLQALSSFCFFAGVGVLMLYVASLTIFSSFMVWDIRRQMNQKTDCFGLCCCRDDSYLFCKGKLITKKHRQQVVFYDIKNCSNPEEHAQELHSSFLEVFMEKYFAKYLLTIYGIISVLVLYFILICISIYGVSKLEIDFRQSYFISDDAYIKQYITKQEQYFQRGDLIHVYTDFLGGSTLNNDVEGVQEQLNQFNQKLVQCEGCQQKWVMEDTFQSWYELFKAYSQSQNDFFARTDGEHTTNFCFQSWNEQKQIVTADRFQSCLNQFLSTDLGQPQKANILFMNDGSTMEGFRQSIMSINIESAAKEGVQFLLDIRYICDEFGIDNTFANGDRFLDYETYVHFERETIIHVASALAAVLVVILLITASVQVTMFVLICVALVDLFLFALLAFWKVTLNSVTGINIVIAIGLAVDYSAHIGHAYLYVDPPEASDDGQKLTKYKKRIFKAKGALKKMGSSVFHGAFSTLLAIIVLSPSNSYIFKSFFKMWFGIIIFGMLNGFVLLPVMLSLCGPLNKVVKFSYQEKKDKIQELEMMEAPDTKRPLSSQQL